MKTILLKHNLHNIVNISKIATMGYWELSKDFSIENECFDTWKLTYADMGEVVATSGKKTFLLKAGDIIFNKPNDIHHLHTNNGAPANVFVITFVCRSPAIKCLHGKCIHLDTHQRKLIARLSEESEGVFSFFPAEIPCKNTPSKKQSLLGGEQMLRIHLEHLLILLMRGKQQDLSAFFDSNEDFSNKLVKQIVQFMEENICRNITLDEISKKFNYSNTHICTVFKEETGYSVINYHTKKKIDVSKKILREGLMNITQVSDYLNFCNPHYFSCVFKKWAHMSPREYQHSMQSEAASVKVKHT